MDGHNTFLLLVLNIRLFYSANNTSSRLEGSQPPANWIGHTHGKKSSRLE
jgi:hypothetical protein